MVLLRGEVQIERKLETTEVLQVSQFVIKTMDMWLRIENISNLLMRTRFKLDPW